ncbi:MAG TPA: prolyl oligopeptidase family serine peptidase [Bacteroidales bacterium]|nr:prolyl oligopeptidase family serine peptidase [Bacteroidales bacterium]
MKKLFQNSVKVSILIVLFSTLNIPTYAAIGDKQLDSTVFETWRTCESIKIADDASWSIAEYKNKEDSSILVIKIDKINFRKEIKKGKNPQMFNNMESAVFFVKDTLFTINGHEGTIQKIGITKSASVNDKSPFFTYKRGKTLFISNVKNGSTDSIKNVGTSIFINPETLTATVNEGKSNIILIIRLGNKKGIDTTQIYKTDKFITDVSSNKNGDKLIFFTCIDSLLKSPEVTMIKIKERSANKINLNESLLPEGMQFNIKKGIVFSQDDSYLKFEIEPVKANHDKSNEKVSKPPFDLELWRWNDTLIPLQQKRGPKAFEKSMKCAFYPETNKFVQLSTGKGVYLQIDDNSPYGIEFNERPYLYRSNWEDPTPRDIICIDVKTGERKILLKEFKGSIAVSPRTPHLFIFEPENGEWSIIDTKSGAKTLISDLIDYPLQDEEFDRPQPAGSYGQAGVSRDNQYFLVYDKYDVWALPTSGIGEPLCITNGYGRKHNIRFRILKIESDSDQNKNRGVNLKETIFLESLNLNNMYSGYYKVAPGKDPVKLIEDACKFSFYKKLGKDNYIFKKESFDEAPDFWLSSKDFQPVRRLTDLNEQICGYFIGKSKVITWSDGSGKEQKGVLYTPADYDSSKQYPVIVYFYETMTENTFLFYHPLPTESTINPILFVSRGYVVFMPDIHYEIGWPGKSCVNTVVSGTEYLIKEGIADPERIGVQGHSWGGYQVAFLITQSDIFKCACSEAAVTNMTSAYTGIRYGSGSPRMFMYECSQSRIGGNLWEKQNNYILNSPTFFLNRVTTPLLSRHCDADEAVPYSQGLELFLGLRRLGKEVWMFNYEGVGHNIKPWEVKKDWTKRMDEYFDYYLMDKEKPSWM